MKDNNDRNGFPGWWMDEVDMKKLITAWEGVEAVRDGWK